MAGEHVMVFWVGDSLRSSEAEPKVISMDAQVWKLLGQDNPYAWSALLSGVQASME